MTLGCTGLTATWCPFHGDCTCQERGYPPDSGVDPGERTLDDGTCPLHGLDSDHPSVRA